MNGMAAWAWPMRYTRSPWADLRLLQGIGLSSTGSVGLAGTKLAAAATKEWTHGLWGVVRALGSTGSSPGRFPAAANQFVSSANGTTRERRLVEVRESWPGHPVEQCLLTKKKEAYLEQYVASNNFLWVLLQMGGGSKGPGGAMALPGLLKKFLRVREVMCGKEKMRGQCVITGEGGLYLIKEVENAAFTDIEDGVPFVKWLYDELSYLVDERAVLKHFEWPEQKADTLRKVAFGYCDLKKLESEASSFRDDPQ
ncbi:hypothetical protein LguiA_026340 [Lonicera macranthoides]